MTVARVAAATLEVLQQPPTVKGRVAAVAFEVLRANSDPPLPQPESPGAKMPIIMVVS